MNHAEAEAVVDALDRGRRFSFENYAADSREVLEFDPATESYLHSVHHAYAPEIDRDVFTREQFLSYLEAHFSYSDFALPPVARVQRRRSPGGARRGRGRE